MRSFGRCVHHFGASPAGLWLIKHVVSPIDRFVVRVSGGRMPPPSRLLVPSLLLSVAGAKTGRERTVPLVYVRDGPRFVVANARPAGERRNPWVANLRASGRARIQVGRRSLEVTAHEIAHRDVPRYWPALTAAWPSFADAYAATGERTLFALEPIDSGNPRPPDHDRPSAADGQGTEEETARRQGRARAGGSNMHLRLAGWKTDHGHHEYLRAYDAALGLWTAPYENLEIPTRFGLTRAIASGAADAPPLFLLPAATGIGALQWYPNIGDLAARYRVVALDFVAGPGGGTQTRAMIDRLDYAAWLTDVLDDLDVPQARFVGSSQGGWIVLNLCVLNPDRVEAAALLAPAASLAPFSWQTQVSLRLHPPAWTAKGALRAILGPRAEIDVRISNLMAAGLKHFRYQQRSVFPDVFGDTALSRVAAPVLVMIGDREIIYDPVSALARAGASIPGSQAELVPDCGHLLNLEMPELVVDRLLRFFDGPGDRETTASTEVAGAR